MDRFYSGVSRYTTSGFFRMKLCELLEKRGHFRERVRGEERLAEGDEVGRTIWWFRLSTLRKTGEVWMVVPSGSPKAGHRIRFAQSRKTPEYSEETLHGG